MGLYLALKESYGAHMELEKAKGRPIIPYISPFCIFYVLEFLYNHDIKSVTNPIKCVIVNKNNLLSPGHNWCTLHFRRRAWLSLYSHDFDKHEFRKNTIIQLIYLSTNTFCCWYEVSAVSSIHKTIVRSHFQFQEDSGPEIIHSLNVMLTHPHLAPPLVE